MNKCPKCSKSTTIWSRNIISGICISCQATEANEREKMQPKEQRGLEDQITVKGKTIACPICGHTQFAKQRTLMNTRTATFMNMDWLDVEAETCICKDCGYVLWFRK